MSRAQRPARSAAASRRCSTRPTRPVLHCVGWCVAVAASSTLAAAPAAAQAAGAVRGVEVCTSEEHRWSGSLDLAAEGATASTEMEIPSSVGTWLRVAGISADGLTRPGSSTPSR